MPRYTFRFGTEPPPHITVTVPAANAEEARAKAEIVAGVSHLLHTKRPSHLRAFLDKLGNIEGEVLDRLIDLNIVLPGCCGPDAIVVFLKSS